MAYFDRKIIYLSYMEYGERIKSAGFVKIENSNKECVLDMRITGMQELPDISYELQAWLQSGDLASLGTIFLRQGKGEWQKRFETGKHNGTEIRGEEFTGFLIELSDYQLIEGKIQNRESSGQTQEKEQEKKEEKKQKPVKDSKSITRVPELKAGSMEPASENKNAMPFQNQKEKDIQIESVILDDKWKQLMRIYPVIHPYEDEREYISIQPKDFVIMTGNYQHLANNSFLLHGFYNYRHIILGKECVSKTDENKNTAEKFYLGVPGVFYEREKMVALMFGFEAFECAGGKSEIGKFGYYLRTVCI